jgi:hypothetical protein
MKTIVLGLTAIILGAMPVTETHADVIQSAPAHWVRDKDGSIRASTPEEDQFISRSGCSGNEYQLTDTVTGRTFTGFVCDNLY